MSTPYDTAPSLESVLADERITVTGLLFEVEAALLRRLDTELRAQVGMSAAFFEVLVRLGRSPRGRMRLADLARQLSITTGGVTRLIDRIQEAGFIRRVPDPEDRRSVFAEITPAGVAALRPAVACQLESIQRYLVDPLMRRITWRSPQACGSSVTPSSAILARTPVIRQGAPETAAGTPGD